MALNVYIVLVELLTMIHKGEEEEEEEEETRGSALKRHYCRECGKSFSVRARFRRHMRIHTGDKPYRCSHCQLCFTSQENLSEHAQKHSGQRPHRCSQCGKGFFRPGRLEIHRRIHSGEKPHGCAQCEKSFKSGEELRRHTLTHTEKQHHCCQCQWSFRRSGHLRRHMRTHTGERPYGCAECERSFARPEHLRGHQLRVHRNQTHRPAAHTWALNAALPSVLKHQHCISSWPWCKTLGTWEEFSMRPIQIYQKLVQLHEWKKRFIWFGLPGGIINGFYLHYKNRESFFLFFIGMNTIFYFKMTLHVLVFVCLVWSQTFFAFHSIQEQHTCTGIGCLFGAVNVASTNNEEQC